MFMRYANLRISISERKDNIFKDLNCLKFYFFDMIEVFSECVRYRYKARMCSKSIFFVLFVTFLTVLFPLIFSYKSHGFWMKTATYLERPDVHFKYEYLLIMQTERLDSPIICSSLPSLNNLFKEKNSCPIIKVRELDVNRDGYNDVLHFELEALLEGNENIYGLTLLLLFDYKLYITAITTPTYNTPRFKFQYLSSIDNEQTMFETHLLRNSGHCYLEMESLGIIQEMTSIPGSGLDFAADLHLVQKSPLHTKIHNVFYKKSIFHSKNFDIKDVFKEYAARNASTRFVNNYALWSYGRAATDPFILSAQINYETATVLYKPGFWQEIKWAWMQYFSVLVPFLLLFREIKSFIFSNHIMNTYREVPWRKIS